MKILILTSFVFCTFAYGDKVFRISIESENDANKVNSLLRSSPEFDVWKSALPSHPYTDVLVPEKLLPSTEAYLDQSGLKHNIMISDVQSLIHSQTSRRKSRRAGVTNLGDFDYSLYHTADEIEAWLDLAAQQFDYVTKMQVGITYQGRPISALKISKQSSAGVEKPVVYIDALIHCREWIATAATIFAFKEMLLDPVNSWMLDELDWIFIPMINVDGYIFTWADPNNRMWRKTLSGGNSRCVGTDGNRNWDNHWDGSHNVFEFLVESATSSDEPCSSLFHGTHAESEPEVRHRARFIAAHNNSIKALITVHSYAQVIIFPYNFAEGEYPPNVEEQNSTAEAMSKAIFDTHGMNYTWGSAAEVMYVSSGISTDWTQATAQIDINYTMELRDTGEYGFLLPADQIIPTGEEFLAAVRVLARHVSDKWNNGTT